MSLHAWRTVHPTQEWKLSAKQQSTYDGPYHRAGDLVVYAWSRSELSAMSVALRCGGIDPEEMLWEKLSVPREAPIVELANSEPMSPDLLLQLRKNDLLGAWVPTSLSPDGLALVVNPLHPLFEKIAVVEKRFLKRTHHG